MTTRVDNLTGLTLESAPAVCHDCVWWQTRGSRSLDKRRWIERVEERFGAWGAIYRDDDGRVLDRRGRAVEWLFAAGDVVGDLPRTALMAVARGVRAGTIAATT